MFTADVRCSLARDQSATVSGYTSPTSATDARERRRSDRVAVELQIHHGGSDLGVYAPAISTFPGTSDGIGTPSMRTGLLRDVYLTLVSSPNQKGRITIGVDINAMVVWLWIGGFVIALGNAARPLAARAAPDATGGCPAGRHPDRRAAPDPGA